MGTAPYGAQAKLDDHTHELTSQSRLFFAAGPRSTFVRLKLLRPRCKVFFLINRLRLIRCCAAAYTARVFSSSRACCCLASGVVSRVKVGSCGGAPGRRQTLRTTALRWCSSEPKLCAGVPSSSVLLDTLRTALGERLAGATGSRCALAACCSSAKSSGRQACIMCNFT